jgi:hypothetical protein
LDYLAKDDLPSFGALGPVSMLRAFASKASLLKGLKRISSLSPQVTRSYLVYSGDYFEFSDGITALKYDQVKSPTTSYVSPTASSQYCRLSA